MKKTLTAAALSSALVLGLASAAMAVHATDTAEQAVVAKGASKITLDGSVRERGAVESNSAAEDDANKTYYDSRVQLGVKAAVSEQATGYVQLETNANSGDTETWGNGDSAGLTSGGDKNGTMSILQAWVNYQPGMWGVKAGHMPLALGNKVFYDHTGSGDDALVFYANPNEAIHVAALTIKFDEALGGPVSGNDNSNDLDAYVGLVTFKVNDNLNLGGNWTYVNGVAEDEAAAAAGMGMSNIGLTADGKVGAISYLADVEMQFGTVNDNGTSGGDSDASGWAAKLGGNYDLGAGKIGLLFGYGSGDDANDTDNDHDEFINFLTDTTYDTIIAEYRQAIPGAAGPLDNTKNTGLSNLTLFQLNGSTKTTCPLTGKDLSLFASASYMQLSEDTNKYVGGALRNNGEDSVGTELDLIATWALTPGLNYKVEAAYLFVGDVYETAANGDGSDPDDLVFIRHGLELKF